MHGHADTLHQYLFFLSNVHEMRAVLLAIQRASRASNRATVTSVVKAALPKLDTLNDLIMRLWFDKAREQLVHLALPAFVSDSSDSMDKLVSAFDDFLAAWTGFHIDSSIVHAVCGVLSESAAYTAFNELVTSSEHCSVETGASTAAHVLP